MIQLKRVSKYVADIANIDQIYVIELITSQYVGREAVDTAIAAELQQALKGKISGKIWISLTHTLTLQKVLKYLNKKI